MKRSTPAPFVLLVLLAVAAFFKPGAPATPTPGDPASSGDTAWMLTASALVLLMTPGLSFFYGGMVGFKNVVSTMLQSVVALGVISLALGRWSASAWPSAMTWAGYGIWSATRGAFFMFANVGDASTPRRWAPVPR